MENMISVIIPVYNVEAYIRQSIESVCNQTYKNLQILLIDDGSTDGSGEICDEYAMRDKRIVVVHQKNGGAANAKNTGLKLAKGEYLAFLDSDDYLESDAYSFMVEQLNHYHADIVQCGFNKIFRDRSENKMTFSEVKEFDVCSYLKLFTEDWTCGLLWDKLYRRKVFDEICFEEGHKIDDEFFTYKGVMNSSKIVCVPKVIYNYRQRLSGVMLSETSQEKIVEDTLEYLTIRRKNVIEKYPQLKQEFDEHYLNMLLILSRKSEVSVEVLVQLKQALKMYRREKKKIKISFLLWRGLMKLQLCPVKKLLKQRMCSEKMINTELYFQ